MADEKKKLDLTVRFDPLAPEPEQGPDPRDPVQKVEDAGWDDLYAVQEKLPDLGSQEREDREIAQGGEDDNLPFSSARNIMGNAWTAATEASASGGGVHNSTEGFPVHQNGTLSVEIVPGTSISADQARREMETLDRNPSLPMDQKLLQDRINAPGATIKLSF